MAGLMPVRQKAAGVAGWNAVFRDLGLDAVRRRPALVVTSAGLDAGLQEVR